MKKIITGVLAAAAIATSLALAPTASAISCDELDAKIIAHNNASPGDNASQSTVDGYNQEADYLNNMPCYDG